MTQNQPLLGLATTRDLLTELAARGRVSRTDPNHVHLHSGALELEERATQLLRALPGSLLDYRTVGDPDERARTAATAYMGPEGWTFRDEEPPTKQPMLRDHTRGND